MFLIFVFIVLLKTLLPRCSYLYVQGYNPAVHMLRRMTSETSIFTWLMLGGANTINSDMSSIRSMDHVGNKFHYAACDFLKVALMGCAFRLETDISASTSSDVLSLLDTYGSRIVEFVLSNDIIVATIK